MCYGDEIKLNLTSLELKNKPYIIIWKSI